MSRSTTSSRPKRPTPVFVESSEKLTVKDFTLLGIEKLRVGPDRGIHVVFTGFNDAFRAYFPGLDVVAEMKRLAEEGVIKITPSVRGVSINTPQPPKAPNPLKRCSKPAVGALVKMGLASNG